MKLAISYFYQIRHFKRNFVPVSTATWDPKWYHDFREPSYSFIDKRGVVNGLRCEELHGDETCHGLCWGDCNPRHPEDCDFLRLYRKQLDRMDLDAFLHRAETAANKLKEMLKFEGEPVIVLIVHEAPWNKCSEREVLLEYFKDNNVDCKELTYPISSDTLV